jgi:hypothetical protein
MLVLKLGFWDLVVLEYWLVLLIATLTDIEYVIYMRQ